MITKSIICGILLIEEKEYSFVFDQESFRLKVFPGVINGFTFEMLNASITISSKAKRGWVRIIDLDGKAYSGECIRFKVQDNPSYMDGIKVYEVVCFIQYVEEFSLDAIDGLRITGEDINLFYPSASALKMTVVENANHYIDSAGIETVKQPYMDCGKVRIARGVDAHIEIKAAATVYSIHSAHPITADSHIRVSYSSPVNDDVVIKTIRIIELFLQYVLYRKNVVLDKIELYWEHEGKSYYRGIIGFKNEYVVENHKDKSKRVIKYDFFNKKTGAVITKIKNNKFRLDYLCDSIDDTRHYTISRCFGILSAFEREFRNLYGVDYGRSELYDETKAEMVCLLNSLASESKGKKKKYIKGFAKGIMDNDVSLADKVNSALLDCGDIINPFVINLYGKNDEDTLIGISERMGAMRNGIAHSRLDMDIKPIHIDDLKIIEVLIYAMWLKTISKDTSSVIGVLSDLFGLRIKKDHKSF